MDTTKISEYSTDALKFILGALSGELLGRLRRRLAPIRWSAVHWSVAFSSDTPQFGKVEVRYQNAPVQHLSACRVEFENEGNVDLEDVAVNLAYADGTTLYVSSGAIEGSLNWIPFTDEFSAALRAGRDLNYLTTQRSYRIPVLNRRTKAIFFLLLGRPDNTQPVLRLGCDHPGIRLRFETEKPQLFGVPQFEAAIIALVLTLVITILLAWRVSNVWLVGLGAWFVAIVGNFFGVALIKLYRWFSLKLS